MAILSASRILPLPLLKNRLNQFISLCNVKKNQDHIHISALSARTFLQANDITFFTAVVQARSNLFPVYA
jgi:hypothetical protein